MARKYSILLLLFFPQFLVGQYSNDELKTLLETASVEVLSNESARMLFEGYFGHGEAVVDKLLSSDAHNANYNYRKGYILTEGRGMYKEAIPYLEKAVMWAVKNYDYFSGKEVNAPIDARYYLGKCYHRTGNIDKAFDCYTAYLGQSAGQKLELIQLSQLALKQLEVAKKSLKYPKKNVKIINMGTNLNTPYPDYSPVVSFDGSALYYTSRRAWLDTNTVTAEYDLSGEAFTEDIYVSYRDFDDSWMEPTRLEFCKPDFNEASLSVSNDERRIYVYQDNIGNGDIFFSDFETNRFQEIRPFQNKLVNTPNWETHCFVTPDGQNLYFTSDRPGGYGGRDIYRIVRLPGGNWSQPFNLGPHINSEYDEESPFMSIDNKTLYFASNGPSSMGGYDIFVTIIDDENQWSKPINLGSPLNSTEDDLFYTETIDGRRGYITSTREDTKGGKDIYEVQNDYLNRRNGSIFKGKIITNSDTKIPEDVTATISTSDLAGTITVYPRLRDGVFMMPIDPCREYDIVFHKDNGKTEIFRQPLETNCDQQNMEIFREVVFDPATMTVVEIRELKPVVIDTVVVASTTTPADTNAAATTEQAATHENDPVNENHVAESNGQTQQATDRTKEIIASQPGKKLKTAKTDDILALTDGGENTKHQATDEKGITETKIPAKGSSNTATGTNAQEVINISSDPKTTTTTEVVDGNVITTTVVTTTTTKVIKSSSKLPVKEERTSLRHYFGYNNIKFDETNDSLVAFLKEVERKAHTTSVPVTLEIYASASQVPTKMFGSNQRLANIRARSLKRTLREYLRDSEYDDLIDVKIVSAIVSGPRYQKDSRYKEKYIPFQYVEIRVKKGLSEDPHSNRDIRFL